MNGKDLSEEKLHDLKRQMMCLWSETFHDTSKYIDIVFDAYFSPDNVFVCYDGETLVAALLGVPYEFKITEDGEFSRVKGMYLCGLSTRPSYRNQGIMSGLMVEAENAALQQGYDMTFLIPANGHLRQYYGRKGYLDSSFRYREKMTGFGNPAVSNLKTYYIRDFFRQGKEQIIAEIASWCQNRENNSTENTILHSARDFSAIMAENENSFFLTNDAVDLKYTILANIESVVFPQPKFEENGVLTVEIVGLYLKNSTSMLNDASLPFEIRNGILNSIHETFPGCESVELVAPWNPDKKNEKGSIEPYAMTKPLNLDSKTNKCEDQTFDIFLMLD